MDGLWGCGKTVLSSIVSGMENVEKVKLEYLYEYICQLVWLKKIELDAAVSLLKTCADVSQYNNLIGRGVNLRWRDETGLVNCPNTFRYLARLLSRDTDKVVEKINNRNIALNINSHMLLLVADPIFQAFDRRIKIIEMVRRPLYVVKHWYAFLMRFYSPRVFTLSIDCHGEKLPWFTAGWEEDYLEAKLMDRVLISIIKLYHWQKQGLQEIVIKNRPVLTLSFESLVGSHHVALQQLQDFLGRKHFSGLSRVLRQQKIPRKTISQGRGHHSYGWTKACDLDERKIYRNHWDFVKAHGTPHIVEEFVDLIQNYNAAYPSVLAKYQ